MSHFSYRNAELYAEDMPLTAIAERFGTPVYVYSRAALTENYCAYANACNQNRRDESSGLVCYSVKANSNLAVLNVLVRLGAGFAVASEGELLRVLAAGGDPRKVIFSGVGKSREEMRRALCCGIFCFNVESPAELLRLSEVAQSMDKQAAVALRINPDIGARSAPEPSARLRENKFGIGYDDALAAYRMAATLPHIRVTGIDCHIGSQLLDDTPLLQALEQLIELVDCLADEGIRLQHLNVGGGLGVSYGGEPVIAAGDYLKRLFVRVNKWRLLNYQAEPILVLLEPGRSITADAGVLLTRVEYLKHGAVRNFAVVDAAMNDLVRPAMYSAWHRVLPVVERTMPAQVYDVVGPICESGDWLARGRSLALRQDDLLAIMSAGAYGMSMSSNYHSRGRAAEVMIDGDQAYLIREREKAGELFGSESLLP